MAFLGRKKSLGTKRRSSQDKNDASPVINTRSSVKPKGSFSAPTFDNFVAPPLASSRRVLSDKSNLVQDGKVGVTPSHDSSASRRVSFDNDDQVANAALSKRLLAFPWTHRKQSSPTDAAVTLTVDVNARANSRLVPGDLPLTPRTPVAQTAAAALLTTPTKLASSSTSLLDYPDSPAGNSIRNSTLDAFPAPPVIPSSRSSAAPPHIHAKASVSSTTTASSFASSSLFFHSSASENESGSEGPAGSSTSVPSESDKDLTMWRVNGHHSSASSVSSVASTSFGESGPGSGFKLGGAGPLLGVVQEESDENEDLPSIRTPSPGARSRRRNSTPINVTSPVTPPSASTSRPKRWSSSSVHRRPLSTATTLTVASSAPGAGYESMVNAILMACEDQDEYEGKQAEDDEIGGKDAGSGNESGDADDELESPVRIAPGPPSVTATTCSAVPSVARAGSRTRIPSIRFDSGISMDAVFAEVERKMLSQSRVPGGSPTTKRVLRLSTMPEEGEVDFEARVDGLDFHALPAPTPRVLLESAHVRDAKAARRRTRVLSLCSPGSNGLYRSAEEEEVVLVQEQLQDGVKLTPRDIRLLRTGGEQNLSNDPAPVWPRRTSSRVRPPPLDIDAANAQALAVQRGQQQAALRSAPAACSTFNKTESLGVGLGIGLSAESPTTPKPIPQQHQQHKTASTQLASPFMPNRPVVSTAQAPAIIVSSTAAAPSPALRSPVPQVFVFPPSLARTDSEQAALDKDFDLKSTRLTPTEPGTMTVTVLQPKRYIRVSTRAMTTRSRHASTMVRSYSPSRSPPPPHSPALSVASCRTAPAGMKIDKDSHRLSVSSVRSAPSPGSPTASPGTGSRRSRSSMISVGDLSEGEETIQRLLTRLQQPHTPPRSRIRTRSSNAGGARLTVEALERHLRGDHNNDHDDEERKLPSRPATPAAPQITVTDTDLEVPVRREIELPPLPPSPLLPEVEIENVEEDQDAIEREIEATLASIESAVSPQHKDQAEDRHSSLADVESARVTKHQPYHHHKTSVSISSTGSGSSVRGPQSRQHTGAMSHSRTISSDLCSILSDVSSSSQLTSASASELSSYEEDEEDAEGLEAAVVMTGHRVSCAYEVGVIGVAM